MGYVKSHSNYVIKKRHQDTNDGTIFERDITTIGGINRFSKGQLPIYNSGNFIITARETNKTSKDYSNDNWFKNGGEDIVWTYQDAAQQSQQKEDSLSIVLKRDYYSLRDFAYFGSCSELIRASITDIINRFPGELYAIELDNKGVNVFKSSASADTDYYKYEDCEFLVDNPFDLNLHTQYINKDDIENSLRYFCNKGYEEYEFIDATGGTSCITNIKVELIEKKYCPYFAKTTITVGSCGNPQNNVEYKIVALVVDGGKVIYLTNKTGWHIRPKHQHYIEFINSLDAFQKQLLNQTSKPKYTVCFEIIKENSFGYYKELENFTFPTTFGGYNLSVNDSAYSSYIESLIDVADFYDETFCDNLYRNLTHESIKNLDWSFRKEINDELAENYDFGGARVQKLIRLIGREFDELKFYIDGLSCSNTLTYDESNNMPDYFLTDALNNDGWDVTNIFPYKSIDSDKTYVVRELDNEITPYKPGGTSINICYPKGYFISGCSKIPIINEKDNKQYHLNENGNVVNKIQQYITDKAYTLDEINNMFFKFLRLNSRNIFRHKGTIEGIEMILGMFGLTSKRWAENTVSTRFNECESSGSTIPYDYEIKEYVAVSNFIEDSGTRLNNDVTDGRRITIDDFNASKTIVYDTDDFRNGRYNPYQGLPIKQYEETDVDSEGEESGEGKKVETENGEKRKIIVPYFNKDGIIDGNPYYQMNGGWMWKSHQITTQDDVYENGYTETIKTIPSVSNIKELIELPYNRIQNKIIYYVNNINGSYVIINGYVYELKVEYIINSSDDTETEEYEYIEAEVFNNSISVGGMFFYDIISVSSPYGSYEETTETQSSEETTETPTSRVPMETFSLNDFDNGEHVRIYVMDVTNKKTNETTQTISILNNSDDSDFIDWDVTFYRNGSLNGEDDSASYKTNYFILSDVDYKHYIVSGVDGDVFGWKQLKKYDVEYKQLSVLENYFNGNNPHCGDNKYDSGEEYFTYFEQLFKYAIEEKAFDERCFRNEGWSLNDIIERVKDYGFHIQHKVEHDKISYIGKISPLSGEPEMTVIDNLDITKLDEDHKDYDYIYNEQIMNVKYVDLIFYYDGEELPKEYIKYMDDVVMKYVGQMIPPNTILTIKYEKYEDNKKARN